MEARGGCYESPASKTPALPFLRKRILQEIYENTRCITKELDITRSKTTKLKIKRYIYGKNSIIKKELCCA